MVIPKRWYIALLRSCATDGAASAKPSMLELCRDATEEGDSQNWDADVRGDMEKIFDRLVPENMPYYRHNLEGSDDMPAHAKCIITGVSINIPITDGRLNLGMWQRIYLFEFRNDGGARKVVATIVD